MLSSIRSRLWLSYAAVIFLALTVVTTAVTLFLIRNPYTYRQAALRLSVVEGLANDASTTPASFASAANALTVRVLVVSPDGRILSDSGASQSSLRNLGVDRRVRQITTTLDNNGRLWLLTKQRLPDGNLQVFATPRPALLPVLSVVRDELWRPLFQAGLWALALSLVPAYLIARWIADPMQDLIKVVGSVGRRGDRTDAPALAAAGPPAARAAAERGPREVRDLARAFDAMFQRVSEMQRSQKDFTANVSHELKTPLTSIQGFAQALLDGTAASEDSRRRAAETIQIESGRMYRMATDLLELARLDSGGVEFRREPVDVGALLTRLRDRFELFAAAAGVTLNLETTTTVPVFEADGDRLGQALGNILENSIKFAPPGSEVLVRAEASSGELMRGHK